jgi:hypothetical protein
MPAGTRPHILLGCNLLYMIHLSLKVRDEH